MIQFFNSMGITRMTDMDQGDTMDRVYGDQAGDV
jgi:hypothetical protein